MVRSAANMGGPAFVGFAFALSIIFLASIAGSVSTAYSIHLSIPISDPAEDPVQVQQWISAATQAASLVSSRWSSMTGNKLQIDTYDNEGNTVSNLAYGIASAENTTNVVALISSGRPGSEALTDDLARMSRYFQLPVLSPTARRTSVEASPLQNTFIGMAPQHSFDATVFAALISHYGWHKYSILSDGTTSDLNGIVDALAALPQSNSSLLVQSNVVIDSDPSVALQSCLKTSANVIVIVGSNTSIIQPFLNLSDTSGFGAGRFSLLDGFPVAALASAPSGAQLLEIVDANIAARQNFVNMMIGTPGFPAGSTELNLTDHVIHTFDAVMAIARAIEVAETQTIPATRNNILQALNSSDYVGYSGGMNNKDSQGFRQSGYARILNNQNGQITIPWVYEQGVLTSQSPVLYSGNTHTVPDAQMDSLVLGQLASLSNGGPPIVTEVIQFAMDLVNANSTWMPPETRFVLVNCDDAESAVGEISGALAMHNAGVVGVIGATTSTLAIAGQSVLAPFHIPQFSTSATNAALSNKNWFPTFFRNVAPDNFQGVAIVQLCRYFGWSKIGLIASTDSYGAGLSQTIAAEAALAGISLLGSVAVQGSDTNLTLVQGMTSLKQAGTRIVVIVAQTVNINAIVGAMALAEFSPAAVVTSDAILSVGIDYLATSTNLPASAFNGWIGTNPPGGFGDFWKWIQAEAALVTATAPNKYPSLAGIFGSGYTGVALTIDAVFIYADAVRRVTVAGGDPRDGSVLLAALLSTNLTLCTGTTFFTSTGDRIGPYDILNVANGSITTPARFDYEALSYLPNSAVPDGIVWPSGSNVVPLDALPRTKTWLAWSSGGGIAMAVLAAFGLLCVVLTLIVVVWQRESPIIVSSTWEFLIIMLIGSAIGYGSIFAWIGEPVPYLCALRIWLPPMAFVLIMAPLLAKTWRLHRIFTLSNLKISPIPLWKLMIFAGVLVVIQVVICAFWIGLGSITTVSKIDPSNPTVENIVCEQTRSNQIATWITFGWTGLCLLIGGYYAFRVRNLPKEFNESRWIGFSIYNAALAAIIVIILGYSLPTFPSTVNILICIATFIIATGCIAFMMLPKVWNLIMHPEKRSGSHSRQTSSKSDKNGLSTVSATEGSMTSYQAARRHDFSRKANPTSEHGSSHKRSHNS